MTKRKTSIKRSRVAHVRGTVDVSNWTIGAAEELSNRLHEHASKAIDDITDSMDALILKAVADAISSAMKSDDTGVDWPHRWSNSKGLGDGREIGNEKPTKRVDPLTIYLRIALSTEDSSDPEFAFNLRDGLVDAIRDCQEDGSFSDGLARIKDALRALADEIEAALPKE